MYQLIGILCGIFLMYYLCVLRPYKKSTYYQTTHKGYFSMRRKKGSYGEYKIYRILSRWEGRGGLILLNCYLPARNQMTSELDLIFFHASGIYVIESKNYTGKITGTETSQKWKEHFGNTSFSFPNPIRQNRTHIRYLRRLIGEELPVYSIIVFSNAADIQEITLETMEAVIIHQKELPRLIDKLTQQCDNPISNDILSDAYAVLYPYSQISRREKKKHVKQIKKAVKKDWNI